MSTNKTIERIQNSMGPKVVQNNDKKMSPLDYKVRDSTDRWSAEDTKKFYKALQLMGTDFGLIETLFEGKRTRNQIKVSDEQLLLIIIFFQNKFNKEQRSNKAKIDSLLEKHIELADYE